MKDTSEIPKPFITRIAKRSNNNRMLRLRMDKLSKKQAKLKNENKERLV